MKSDGRRRGSRRLLLRACWAGLAWLILAMSARAENPPLHRSPQPSTHEPVITGLFPPGVTRGGTTEWTISGRNLGADARLQISGVGIDVVKQEVTTDGPLAVLVRTSETARPGIRELRVDSSAGLSNLVLFRVDTLESVAESEPNDNPADADEIGLNAAASGNLGARDVDHFRIKGRAGQPVTVEVEARRLGSLVAPIVTLLASSGRALIQGRETPGLEGDCRVTSRFPPEGVVIVRIHDALYQSGEGASYRLRAFATPFATAIFPLGGRRGETIEVTASGGTMEQPRRQLIGLPARAGGVIELKPFRGEGAPIVVPRTIIVGEGPEIVEAQQEPGSDSATQLPRGATANGRIDTPGEVDRYRVPVRRGEWLRVAVQAASLGSWLDSVLTVRDVQGRRIAENDDPLEDATTLLPPGSRSQDAFATDSLLVHEAETDGEWRIEVTDRYGNAGAEYGYRLSVEPVRADFRVEFASDPGAEGIRQERGPEGVLNLAPGTTQRVPLKITVVGRTGPIVLRAIELPPGILAEPRTIRPPRGGSRPVAGKGRPTTLHAELLLRVADDAEPVVGELRVVGTSALADGSSLARAATIEVPLHRWAGTPVRRPVFRELSALPVKILSRPGSLRPH